MTTEKLPPPLPGEVGRKLIETMFVTVNRLSSNYYWLVQGDTEGDGITISWPDLVSLANEILRIENERGKK